MKRRPCQVPSDVVTPRSQLAGLVSERLSGSRLDVASDTILEIERLRTFDRLADELRN